MAKLQLERSEGAINQYPVIEGSSLGNTIDFGLELGNFRVQRSAVGIVVDAVSGLNRKLTHALEHVGDLLHGAFGGISKRNAIVSIANSLG